MRENMKVFLLAVMVAGGFFLAGVLAAAIDYALNASIIDAIPASSIQWWHLFTFDHYMAWQFTYNQGTFFAFYVVVAIVIFIVLIVIWYYKS